MWKSFHSLESTEGKTYILSKFRNFLTKNFEGNDFIVNPMEYDN